MTLRIAIPSLSIALLLVGCATEQVGPPEIPGPQPPGAMAVMLVPAAPSSTEDLVVLVTQTAVDPDGDVVTLHYSWWVDGLEQPDLADAAAVLAEHTLRGELWEVRAHAVDPGGLAGPEASASVTIGNSPPGAPSLVLSPEAPIPSIDSIQCVIAEEAVDPDGDALSYSFGWTVNGLAYPESDEMWTGPLTIDHEGDTVPGSDTLPHQHWACEVRASDASAEGAPATAQVSVGETEPQADFSLLDVNETSPSFDSMVSPRDMLEQVSGWYFGHAT